MCPSLCQNVQNRSGTCPQRHLLTSSFTSSTCLSGPVYTRGSGLRIFARTNFVPGPHVWHGSVQFCCSGVYTDPCKVYVSRGIWFQAITAPSEQNVAQFGCLHESVRNVEPWRSKSWPAFFRSQTCTPSRSWSKICPVLPAPYKRKVEPCKFLSVQRFVRTCVNGVSAERLPFWSIYNGITCHLLRVF